MKFKLLFSILFFLVSCTTSSKLYNKTPFNSSGFAYIYNDNDYENNLIKGKLDNTKLEISNSELKLNSLIKIINPKTNESMVLKNTKKIEYPDFYKIIITKKVAKKLNINSEITFVEIKEIKKNKSIIAKKDKIFKNKNFKKSQKREKFFILIGSFSQKTVAKYLKNRIIKEIPNYDSKKLKIIKKSNIENNLLSGPYYTINLMKNDYILLKNLGFEELNIVY